MPDNSEIERLCEVMHDAYERAAVGAGWETQQASRKPWADVPEANKATMRAAVGALLEALPLRQPQIHFNEYTQMRVPGGPCNCVGRRQGDRHLDACPQRSAKVAHEPIGVLGTDVGPFVRCSCGKNPTPKYWIEEHWAGDPEVGKRLVSQFFPDPDPRPVVDREALEQLLIDHAVGRHVPKDASVYRSEIADAVLALLPEVVVQGGN